MPNDALFNYTYGFRTTLTQPSSFSLNLIPVRNQAQRQTVGNDIVQCHFPFHDILQYCVDKLVRRFHDVGDPNELFRGNKVV